MRMVVPIVLTICLFLAYELGVMVGTDRAIAEICANSRIVRNIYREECDG